MTSIVTRRSNSLLSRSTTASTRRRSFIASLGVRTLMLSAKTLMRRGSELVVCGANENVDKVLRGTGFNEVAGLYPDYESASRTLKERLGAFPGKQS